MPDYTVHDPVTGRTLVLRGDSPPTEAELTAIFGGEGASAAEPPGTSGALGLAAVGEGTPLAARAALEFATNPNVPKAAAAIGRTIGGLAPPIGGAIEAGPIGGIAGLAASAKGAYMGSKTGWFSGKLLQHMSAPVAKALEVVRPYMQAVSTLSGAQGALDLAQMQDPKRTDLGFLGIGTGDPGDAAHPALLNLLMMKASEAIKQIMDTSDVKMAEASKAYETLRTAFGPQIAQARIAALRQKASP